MGAADGLRCRCGAGIIGPDVQRHATTIEALRTRLGADAFAAAFGAGQALTLAEVFALMDGVRIAAALATERATSGRGRRPRHL